jgi:copper chaperone CopZ
MYLYGVTYAIASLSCTLPVFLVVVGSAAAFGGIAASLAMFIAYGLGMAVVLLGAALFQGAVARWLRTVMPYVQRVSAVLLILVGLYLVVYQLQNSFGIGIGLQSSQVPSLQAITSQASAPQDKTGNQIVPAAISALPATAAPTTSVATGTPTTEPVATVAIVIKVTERATPFSADSTDTTRSEKGSSQPGSIAFHVPSIITAPTFNDGCCVWASDKWIIERLKVKDGVKEVTVDITTSTVRVGYDPNRIQPVDISAELSNIGYPVEK